MSLGINFNPRYRNRTCLAVTRADYESAEDLTQGNWVEVFYREAKGWLGFSEYQVRDIKTLHRHFILVFCAYTFIIWHKLTGGFRRRWANKSLETFADALAAFRTSMSFRFFSWLTQNADVFAAHKANLGFV